MAFVSHGTLLLPLDAAQGLFEIDEMPTDLLCLKVGGTFLPAYYAYARLTLTFQL